MEVSNNNGRVLYDLEDIYDEQISPLMQQIIKICKEHGMPVLASFAIANHVDEGTYNCTTYLGGGEDREPERYKKALSYVKNGVDGPPMFGTIMIGKE